MPRQYTINGWAIVDFLGHVRLAGYCETVLLEKVPALLVQVPEGPHGPAFECVRGLESIYSFYPTTEEAVRAALARETYELNTLYGLLQLETPDNDDNVRYLPSRHHDQAEVLDDEEDEIPDDELRAVEPTDDDEPPF